MRSKAKYKDVTKKWLDNFDEPNNQEVKINNFFIDDNGIKHPIKGKEKAHITLKESIEYKKSLWIVKTLGGLIYNVPRITDTTNTGIKTPTPDYIWNNFKWDLKIPGTKGIFENTFERFVKKKEAKLQSKKIIIDYINFPDKTDAEIIKVIKKTLKNPYRNWIEDLIIIKDDRIIKIYSKE